MLISVANLVRCSKRDRRSGIQEALVAVGKQRVDGVASEARFKEPTAIALDHYGRLLVAEKHGPDQVRIVDVGLEPPVYFDLGKEYRLCQSWTERDLEWTQIVMLLLPSTHHQKGWSPCSDG
jgi:hypothetical protein